MEWAGQDGIIAGAIIVVSSAIGLLKKNGFISFGRGEKDECPDPSCSAQVSLTAKHLEELKKDFQELKKEMYPTINETAKAVARIEGYHKGWQESLR